MWGARRNIRSFTGGTVDDCEKACASNTWCESWARQVSSGTCSLWNNTYDDTSHIRGVKTSPQPMNIADGLENGPGTKPEDCMNKCTNDSECVGWVHRNNNHTQPQYKNTCVKHKKSTSTDIYNEGFRSTGTWIAPPSN